MSTNTEYFLADGKQDYLRLKILNNIYNAFAINFLLENGLKPGMTVLEYGCGMGFMAIEVAKIIGENGRLIAIDISENSLNIAREEAKKAGVKNIDFRICNIEDVESLNIKFDCIYGRWVLIFNKIIEPILLSLYNILNPNGLLMSEEANFGENGHFSFPYEGAVSKWSKIGESNIKKANIDPNLANKLYSLLEKANFKDKKIKINQPILISAEEKSVYRLGLIISKDTTIKNGIYTEKEIDMLIDEFRIIEKKETIIGFYRNFLMMGKKII